LRTGMTKRRPYLTQIQLGEQGLRKCVTCKQIKPLSDFYQRRDGRSTSQCSSCIKQKVGEAYRKNPEKKRNYQKRFYRKNKEYYLTITETTLNIGGLIIAQHTFFRSTPSVCSAGLQKTFRDITLNTLILIPSMLGFFAPCVEVAIGKKINSETNGL